MDNISSQIGALELDDHLESQGDGVLEATMANPGPTFQSGPCTVVRGMCGDGALEAAGVTMALAPTMRVEGCR
jgi:hypothetical protein